MEKVAFIINPYSAKREYQTFLDELKKKVNKPFFIISKSIEDTHYFIKENLDKIDVFVAVGGDGTISTVARELINTHKVLGIYPAGSGNGFANEANFSKNIDNLIAKLKKKESKEIDTFLVNDLLSINISGAGFDGEVVKRFEKTSRGLQNYIRTSVETFFDFSPITVTFEEKYKQYNGEYMMVDIANTRQFGNNAYIAPNANVADGLVDFILVKKFPAWYSPVFALKMFTKILENDQYIRSFSAAEVEFSLNTNTWHIDGEYTQIPSPIRIKVLPKSLKILV